MQSLPNFLIVFYHPVEVYHALLFRGLCAIANEKWKKKVVDTTNHIKVLKTKSTRLNLNQFKAYLWREYVVWFQKF